MRTSTSCRSTWKSLTRRLASRRSTAYGESVDAFIAGMFGAVPAVVLGIVATASGRLSFRALPVVLGRARAERLRLLVLGKEDEDFAFPKHRLLLALDMCWVVGVTTSIRFFLPDSHGGLVPGLAAAVVFHALGRSPVGRLLAPTQVVVPAVVAGIVTLLRR